MASKAITADGFRNLKWGRKLIALKSTSEITKGKKYSFIDFSQGCGGDYLIVATVGSKDYIYPYSYTGLFALATVKKTVKKTVAKKATKTKGRKTVKA